MAQTRDMKMIHSDVERYYSQKARDHGPAPKGADWKDEASQLLRFQQLLKICPASASFSMNDLGCGYGKLRGYMHRSGFRNFDYKGYDLSKEMVALAKKTAEDKSLFRVISASSEMRAADYTVASGIFNVKLRTPVRNWEAYVLDVLRVMFRKSRKGMAFNILSAYSDKEFMRKDLYYASPETLFNYCKTNFSKNVALLHDYGLYEFTILVRV